MGVTRRRVGAVATSCLLVASLAGVSEATAGRPPDTVGRRAEASHLVTSHAAAPSSRRVAPGLHVRVAVRGLDIPWDVAVLPDRSWLYTQRDRRSIVLRGAGGATRVLARRPSGFWASGETGLMSIVRDPDVSRNNRFYTCTGFTPRPGHHDVRVIAWKLNASHTAARRVETLLSGIQATSGRHGGCRLRFDPRGALYVGTGDATVGTNPQNLRSLNGKVLRLDRFTGRPWPTNPWAHAPNVHRRYVYTYGHRNVQGLAFRPGGAMWSVEHGTDRNDEVNLLRAGRNYGWNPVPGYNEARPMTDFRLPGRQYGARWKSGFPTVATSGATWVRGANWGAYEGTLAVCALKGSRLLFMKFDQRGRLRWVRRPAALRGTYGRLRSVVQGPSGALLVTTANGGGTDKILRVTP